jgi:hypothetical protein
VRRRHARRCRPAGVEGHLTHERIPSEPGRSHAWPPAMGRPGPHAEGEEPKRMTNGREKSDPAIVAAKLANKAGRPAAESVERRAGAKENADQKRTFRTQCRAACHRIWTAYGKRQASPSDIQGRSRMRESRTYGSVRGARSNARPYRERQWAGIGKSWHGFGFGATPAWVWRHVRLALAPRRFGAGAAPGLTRTMLLKPTR